MTKANLSFMDDFHFLQSTFDEEVGQNLPSPYIFVVDDDKAFGESIRYFLEKKYGAKVLHFISPETFLESLKNISYQKNNFKFCLITDISFCDHNLNGLALIDKLKADSFDFISIVMTGFATIETAISATKKGVYHYLSKPFELQELKQYLSDALNFKFGACFYPIAELSGKKLLEGADLDNQGLIWRASILNEDDIFYGMIGRSSKMKDIFQKIKKVAKSSSTIFIKGASGTGKELVANAIHNYSLRSNENIVSINCGAIPRDLLESELFGHEKGAFTGAIANRIGRFELANKGSIFLDEIGDMPVSLQVKLLRVLQSRKIEKVGSEREINIDVRIIAATHRNIEELLQTGEFREDLFYRLNVIPILVPALNERREDIPVLISYFLIKLLGKEAALAITFNKEVINVLMHYSWPGNIRELENFIERLIILKGDDHITLADLPQKILLESNNFHQDKSFVELPTDGLNLKETIMEIESSLIMQALELTAGNKNKASQLLQINRTTLIEKLKKRDLQYQSK